MSQQAHIWSRYHAAALQTQRPDDAAKTADLALAEYNKRFEVLAKYEAELTKQALVLEVRDQQVGIGTETLMVASDLLEAWKRNETNMKEAGISLDDHWLRTLKQLVDRHLRLVGNTYTTVPAGIREDDPRLHRGTR